MNIEQAKQLIPAYLEGDLQHEELQLFKTVLGESDELKAELEAYRRTWDLLGEVEDIEPQAGYVSRFWTRLSLQEGPLEKLLSGLKGMFAKKKWAPLLVTACLFLIVGTFSLSTYKATHQPTSITEGLSEEEVQIIENLELVEYYDVLEDIEIFESIEAIEETDQKDKVKILKRLTRKYV